MHCVPGFIGPRDLVIETQKIQAPGRVVVEGDALADRDLNGVVAQPDMKPETR